MAAELPIATANAIEILRCVDRWITSRNGQSLHLPDLETGDEVTPKISLPARWLPGQ